MWKVLLIGIIANVLNILAHHEASVDSRNGPPNIVFVLVDDMGWNDISFHGQYQIQTPNIDVLASKSVVLQNYYSEAICTPSRSALLTGKYPLRIGMHGIPLDNAENRGIPSSEVLLPTYLHELGYDTHLVGKWHVGMSKEEYLPLNRGYDSHFGIRGGFVDFYTYNKVETWTNGTELCGLDLFDNNEPQFSEQTYITDLFTQKAISIIDNHGESSPMYLQINYNAPHAGNDAGLLQPPLDGVVGSMHIAHSDRRLYSELVRNLDKNIGEVFNALAKNNMLENTIFIFTSDNGAPTVGQFRNWGVNLPLRGIKWTPWEGAVRVPTFMWHSSLKPRVWNGLMHITDWLPTLLEAAGGTIEKEIDGISQWKAITEDTESNRTEMLVAFEDLDGVNYGAYRSGDYKVVVGNVTGKANDYYGQKLLTNKGTIPDYTEVINNCKVTEVFKSLGQTINVDDLFVLANHTLIVQSDNDFDDTPCVPTVEKGCLYNIAKDPQERHDLWDAMPDLAQVLNSTLQTLSAQQQKRFFRDDQLAADPANFNYTWIPWITE